MNKLYKKLKSKNFVPKVVAEVGVCNATASNIYEYILQGVETILVEPDESSINDIKNHFNKLKNVNLVEKAIYDKQGMITLVHRGAATYIMTL